VAQESTPSPAETYEAFTVKYQLEPWTALLLELASPQPGERVLDLACGTGVVTRHLAPVVGPGGSIVGVDINPAMLEVARGASTAPGVSVEWREADAQQLPLEPDSFDLAMCQQGLQFVPDRLKALREVHRVLKPGGRFAFSVWCDLDDHPIYEALFATIALRYPRAAVAAAFSFGEQTEIGTSLADTGFSDVELNTRELVVRFPSAEQFLLQTMRAGAAVNPAAAQMDPAERRALFDEIQQAVQPLIVRHTSGDELSFSMRARLVMAYRQSR
jgi:SAM-dependent methyltransferase